jgi:putative ABC transport system permease protein
MSVIWHKVWYDLWQNKLRTLLAILSIAVGVFAVGTIFGLIDQLLSGMDAAHRAVAPSHVNIILRSYIDEATAAEVAEVPGVVAVDPANQISIRYKTAPDEDWELGSLVMRPDYDQQTLDKMELTAGRWPADGNLGLERLTSAYYGLVPGDRIIVEVAGEEREMTLSGLIRHPFVPPPLFGGQPYFFTDAVGLAELGVPEGRYGQLLIQVEPYSREYAETVAGDVRARLSELGSSVAVTLYQEPDKHWGRMFVEGVTVVLSVMAVVSLILSVVLVTNTLTAVITQQTDQIGVMKAIGGRRMTITRSYLVSVLALGLMALLIAVPLSLAVAYGGTRWFLNIFNIDYTVFQYSPRAVGYQVLAALLAPLLAALWPVMKGARISVREAIASYGLGSDFGSSPLDRGIDALGRHFLPTAYAAALGNLFRRKGRLVLTLLGLTTAGVMFLVVMSLISSTRLTLDNDMARRGYDIRIGFALPQSGSDVRRVVGDIDGVAEAETWFSYNATILRDGVQLQDTTGLGAQLTGIPASSTMERPLIIDGRWLEPGDGNVVVISRETAVANELAVGDAIALNLGFLGEDEWQVIGIYKSFYNTGFVTESLYAPLDAVEESTGQTDIGVFVLVRTASGTPREVSAVANDLKSAFEDAGMKIDLYTTALKSDQRRDLDNQFNSVIGMLQGLAMLVATVGGIGLMGALGISVVERTREIGVLRAIGARSRSILSLFVMEGVLQGFLSWLIAVPIAFVLARPMAELLGRTMIDVELDYAFNWQAVAFWFATVLIVSLLASILPALRATRVSVRESLAYS